MKVKRDRYGFIKNKDFTFIKMDYKKGRFFIEFLF